MGEDAGEYMPYIDHNLICPGERGTIRILPILLGATVILSLGIYDSSKKEKLRKELYQKAETIAVNYFGDKQPPLTEEERKAWHKDMFYASESPYSLLGGPNKQVPSLEEVIEDGPTMKQLEHFLNEYENISNNNNF